MTIRRYAELSTLDTFLDRFRYLSLRGRVGDPTFGSERYINQRFYRSREWKNIRYFVIDRDNGCDLGIPGREIFADLHIHHMNPMTANDIVHGNQDILDPEYLITVSLLTHNAIHYGDESRLPREFVERRPGDTLPW